VVLAGLLLQLGCQWVNYKTRSSRRGYSRGRWLQHLGCGDQDYG
jgi:hypothetical protein